MSRKAKRQSGAPPGPRDTDLGKGAFLLGIVLAFLTLCLAQNTLREIVIGWRRDDYVRDEFMVSSVSSLDDAPTLHGQIVSSGETVNVPLSLVGPDFDRFREMQREGRIKGQRVPVMYLPQELPWWLWGAHVRMIHVSQFEDHFGGWRIAVAITVPLAVVSVFLLLYGLKQIRGRPGEPAT